MAGTREDVLRLAAVIERQRHELALARADRGTAEVIALAEGVLMERNGSSAPVAARQLADMAAAAGISPAEMAAAVLSWELPAGKRPGERSGPGQPAPGRPSAPADDPVAFAAAARARDGAELVAALAAQLRPRFGVAAAAVWLLDADGALELLAAEGLGGTESSRWRRLPPQFDCPEQRVAVYGGDLWWPAGPPDDDPMPALSPWGRGAARAVLPLRDRGGILLGVVEAWWPSPQPELSAGTADGLAAVIAGFTDVLDLRVSHLAVGSVTPSPPVLTALGEIGGSVLVAAPLRDAVGQVTDFTVVYLSPGYRDPAGRPAAEVAGLTLLEAYPAATSAGGLFDRAVRVADSGQGEHVPGLAWVPLSGGGAGAELVADLHVIPFFGGILLSWRTPAEAERLAGLLDHAQRLGSIGAWEEQPAAGDVRWTEAAFALFGLDPAQAVPIPVAHLHSFVMAADRAAVRRFQESLLHRREPAVTVFRIVRPGDEAIRQIRVFAEPVTVGGSLLAVRGAFQDVSAHYHTQVALAATRDQLADSEQRAAEEHQLALRLQRAIMPLDQPPVEASGVDVAVRYRPAEPGHLVGGDWYDVLPLPDGDLLLVVGDITGHGIDAVTGMVAARNALRGLAATGAGPAQLLGHLNYAACHLTDGIAGTVVCGRYQPGDRTLRWARAGHLPPVLVRDGIGETVPMPEGMLLGLDPDVGYQEATLQLRSGDGLLLFTDGLVERRSGSISDALREFAAAAAPAAPDAAALADQALRSALSDTGDDACLVAVRIR